MDDGETPPTGDEFDVFCCELESFMSGYFYALGSETEPAYTGGDFFGERTEAIHFRNRSQLTEQLVRAIQKWLTAPRRNNWRVLVPGKHLQNNYIVIYHDLVVLAPTIDTIANAIVEAENI